MKECLESLKASDCESYRDNLLHKRQEHTCTWFLEDERYQSWIEEDCQSILLVSGGPGCGKSVLASVISKELSNNANIQNDYVLAYFFCDDKDERLRTAHAVLVNLLAQLLKQEPDILIHFVAELEYDLKRRKTAWTFAMLWRVFDRIVKDTNIKPPCLIVDALGTPSLSGFEPSLLLQMSVKKYHEPYF
jgi:DNA replication protein DnaC